jgi:DNA-binding LacI/PurR family transcriptional regulator
MFAVLTNFPNEIFQQSVIEGAREIATLHHHSIEIYTIDGTLPYEMKGLLVIANMLSDERLTQIAAGGTAVSLISHQHERLPSVVPNNHQGISMLMEHLFVERSKRKPLFIRGNIEQYDGRVRELAFEQEVMRYNLREVYKIEGGFSARRAGDEIERFLHHPPDFDCVLAADHLMALAALKVLRENGYRVPEDIAVAGFGDSAESIEGQLTTVAADVVELGRRGARQLIHQMQGLRIRGQTLLSTTLVVRETT